MNALQESEADLSKVRRKVHFVWAVYSTYVLMSVPLIGNYSMLVHCFSTHVLVRSSDIIHIVYYMYTCSAHT